MTTIHRPLFAAILCLLLLVTLPLLTKGAEEEKDLPTKLSPALYLLAEDLPLNKTSLKNSDISFSPEDFDALLGVKKVSKVLISSLPPITEGTLRLGDTIVLKNQIIERTSIEKLRFVPANAEVSESHFTFRAVGSEEYALTCNLFLLERVNRRPEIRDTGLKTTLSTYENIALHGTLPASDPENDALRFEIVSYPKKGLVTLTDRTSGSYVYTPITDYVGKDTFTYIVSDKYGNTSDEKTVTVRVNENKSALVYSDLIGKAPQYAALKLTSAGIMQVHYENGSAVFHPDQSVSRLEFLVMAMQSAGYRVSTNVSLTPFADDNLIDAGYKGYVAAAADMGFISGNEREGGCFFDPSAPITRADASVMLASMMDLPKPAVKPLFPDEDSIPTYAVDAMQALHSLGILSCIGGEIAPLTSINRAQSAELLCAVMEYTDSISR